VIGWSVLPVTNQRMRFHIQELFIDYQRVDEACAIFYYHGWSDVSMKCSELFPEDMGKVKLILLIKFPTKYVAEQVSTKYCTCVINTAIVLTCTRTVETPDDLSWTICNLFQKTCRHKPRARFAVWNQDCGAGTQISPLAPGIQKSSLRLKSDLVH